MAPRITILMGIYNCEDTLAEALDSLYAQTYKNFKLILCDDDSIDNTYKIAQSYAEKYDNIILLKNDKNKKLAATLNRCLEYADTEYVARMDGDDISLPTRLEKQIAFLDKHPEYAVVSTPMIYFDETGDWGWGKANPTPDKYTFRKGTPHTHAPSMTRTKVLKEVNGYTVNSLLNRGQDYYLWYKIYKAGYTGYNLQEHLYKMRDDRNAMARRTFKTRWNGFLVKKRVMKDLGIKYSFFYALPNLIKAFVPNFIMRQLRKKRRIMHKKKVVRITTVPQSLRGLLRGQLKFMTQNGYEVIGVSSPGEALNDVQNNEGVQTIAIEMTRTITPFKDLKALWNFYHLCKKEKPLMVHSHTPKAGIVGMLGAKLAGVPIRLHTVAGLPLMEATGVKRKVLDFVEKLTYACATKVYPISYGMESFILENSLTKKRKVKVLANGSSNGIDSQFFKSENILEKDKSELKKRLKIKENDLVIIFVGRLTGDKGINELITAFKKLTLSDVKLLLVGPFESELDPLQSSTLKEIDLNTDIISVGYQKDVRPYLGISDFMVFPSYREGFGNVVAQAGLMDLPCIVSNITGCNEIIKDGVNGTIIPVKNAKALQQAMEKMITDKPFYEKLKTNARGMIQSRYEQSVVWNALLEEYKTLIKEQGTRK